MAERRSGRCHATVAEPSQIGIGRALVRRLLNAETSGLTLKLPDLSGLGDDRRRLLISALEVVLVVGLAVQGARLVWTLAAPRPVDPAASSAAGRGDALAILTRFDPFFRAAPEALAGATAQSFRLYGVRAGDAGTGSAIIGTPDGKQSSFAVGDEVAPGVKLVSVEVDHVVLARGGARSPLFFPNTAPGAPDSTVQP
jgi:hypothetical protein